MKQQDRVLTQSEIEQFETDGVICLRGVLDPGEIEGLRQSVAKQARNLANSQTGYDLEDFSRQVWRGSNRIEASEAHRFNLDAFAASIRDDSDARPLLEGEHTENGAFIYEAAGWKQFREIREVAFDSKLPRLIADLLKTRTLNFWEDTTFVKTPGTSQKTAFHQDYSYFQISGDQCVIVWMPLDRADLENGVTRYVRGSHRWGEVYAPNLFVSQTNIPGSTDPRCPDIEANEDDYDIVSYDVEPGDVIIHHVLTIHGAGGNLSGRSRRAVSFRYCGDDVRYYDRPGAIPQPFITEKLTNGQKLNSRDYPLVWPKPWPEAKLADHYDFDFQDALGQADKAA